MSPQHDLALVPLGWTAERATAGADLWAVGAVPGRVSRVDHGVVTVLTASGAVRARVPHGHAGLDAPTVGDWVALDPPAPGDDLAVRAVLPRTSVFVRRGAGARTVPQPVAANVDTVLVTMPLDRTVPPRAVERYLAVSWQSGAGPVVVLTKADTCPALDVTVAEIAARAVGVDVVAVSATTGYGLAALDAHLRPGRTVVVVGPSGAGKSTLANALGRGAVAVETGAVRGDGKGRHTTTHRELLPLPGGALLIDTPGMRSLALWDAEEGIEATFADIEELAERCRFGDCEHRTEPDCAVLAAVDTGDLDPGRLESHRRLLKEQRWLRTRQDARARAEESARVRAFSRAVRRRPHR